MKEHQWQTMCLTGRRFPERFTVEKILILSLSLVCFGLVTSCNNGTLSPQTPQEPLTLIVLDNTSGISAALVHSSSQRREEDLIAEIPTGHIFSREWNSGTFNFYFSFRIRLKDVHGFSMIFVPSIGLDRHIRTVTANTITRIDIPLLSQAAIGAVELSSGRSYLVIQNDSGFDFSLQEGYGVITRPISPDWVAQTTTQFEIPPGSASRFHLLSAGMERIYFPFDHVFMANYAETFIFNGSNLTFNKRIGITLANIVDVMTPQGGTLAVNMVPLGNNDRYLHFDNEMPGNRIIGAELVAGTGANPIVRGVAIQAGTMVHLPMWIFMDGSWQKFIGTQTVSGHIKISNGHTGSAGRTLANGWTLHLERQRTSSFNSGNATTPF